MGKCTCCKGDGDDCPKYLLDRKYDWPRISSERAGLSSNSSKRCTLKGQRVRPPPFLLVARIRIFTQSNLFRFHIRGCPIRERSAIPRFDLRHAPCEQYEIRVYGRQVADRSTTPKINDLTESTSRKREERIGEPDVSGTVMQLNVDIGRSSRHTL